MLRDEDVPLVEDDGHYWIPPEEYYLPELGLTDDEHLALALAINAVPLGGDGGGSALQKLGLGRVLDGGPAIAPLADVGAHPHLPALHAAIRRRSLVTFTHRDIERTVEPQMLFFREGNWYLSGFDHVRADRRNYRVDRIAGDVAVGPPGGFSRPRRRHGGGVIDRLGDAS